MENIINDGDGVIVNFWLFYLGVVLLSVGDMLSRCSFIMYLIISFSTGRMVEETVQ